MKLINKCLITSFAVSLSMPALSEGTSDLPVVPVSVIKSQSTIPVQKKLEKFAPKYDKRSKLQIMPGVNEIIVIGIGHLNRFVTPFDHPTLVTTSDATTEIRDNVVYVGTNDPSPVTVYITEKDDESISLSLTLVPKKIPPREIFISLPKKTQYTKNRYKTKTKAKAWEESQSYVDVIRTVFRSIALGEMPSGYSINEEDHVMRDIPSCRQNGIEYDFIHGQEIIGHHLNVAVGTASNLTNTPVMLNEMSCGGWDVAGVAAFPYTMLEPGQVTEIYVARKIKSKAGKRPVRTSLLNEVK